MSKFWESDEVNKVHFMQDCSTTTMR